VITGRVWWDGAMASTADATLGDTGEFGLISELVEIFEGDEHVLVGPR
jgi:thiamine-monophosphate kinase